MARTTVVGSYPRIGDTADEQRLRRAIARFEEGKISEAELREVERSVAADVIREQIGAGIALPTDGQVTWYDSQSHFTRRLEGFEVNGLVRYFDTNTYYRQPVVTGTIQWREPIVVDEWRHAASIASGPVKAVLTGSYTLATLAKADSHEVNRLTREIADALASEVRALRSAGATHIQIDEPAITRSPKDVSLVRRGIEILASEKGSASLSLFIYFGDVALILKDLASLPIDNLGLDLVQGAANWDAIAKTSPTVPLTFGVVDARNTKRDDPQRLAQSVLGLRGHAPIEESYVSPSNGLEFLPREKAREKLGLVVETAKLVEAGL